MSIEACEAASQAQGYRDRDPVWPNQPAFPGRRIDQPRGAICENTGSVQPPAEQRCERNWLIRVLRGSIRWAVDGLASRAERRRDREAADLISRNGKKLTDEIERQIVDRTQSKRSFGPP